MIELELPGDPLTWRAPYVGSRGAWSVRSPIMEQMKAILRDSWKYPLSLPVCIDFLFLLPIPKSTSKKKRVRMISGLEPHVKKKDRSNMLKFAEDVLKGVVIVDDSQIVDGRTAKEYDENPRTVIRIYSIEEYRNAFGSLRDSGGGSGCDGSLGKD